MARRLFEAALGNRLMTIILIVIFVALGVRAMVALPIDASPDVTPNVVTIVTDAPGLGPVEVEKLITFPIEVTMRGLPGIKEIRSISRFGLSSVSVYFEEQLDIYFARRLVMERLPSAAAMIPTGYGPPEMTPVSTTLGEIFQFEVVDPKRSLMDLRSILDWQITPRLKEVSGVVEVNSYGGELKTYEVELRPESLVAYRLSLQDVFRALQANNLSAGGGYIVHNGEQQVIRGSGMITSLADVGNIVVGSHLGVPIYIRNLGRAVFAPMIRQGAVTRDGKGETVAGVVMLLIGQNSRTVVDRVKAKLSQIEGDLPTGVKVIPYYDRADLIQRTISTVAHNLAEGAILVSVLLFLFLGDIRASLIVAAVIPLSMLAAFVGMNWIGVSGNLMSLGAIDFGLIVDGSVVMMENIYRRLAAADRSGTSMAHRVFEAGGEVLRPIVFAIGIIIVVYLPILSFHEVEGKMFRPMALTVIFALCGSLVFALTLVPVLASLLLRPGVHREPWLSRVASRLHERFGRVASRWPREIVIATAAVLILSFAVGAAARHRVHPHTGRGSDQPGRDAGAEHLTRRRDPQRDRGREGDAGPNGGGSRREPNRPARDRNRHHRSGRERRVRVLEATRPVARPQSRSIDRPDSAQAQPARARDAIRFLATDRVAGQRHDRRRQGRRRDPYLRRRHGRDAENRAANRGALARIAGRGRSENDSPQRSAVGQYRSRPRRRRALWD